MKIPSICFLLVIIIASTVTAQNKKHKKSKVSNKKDSSIYYDLRWNVDENNPIAYKTAMEVVNKDSLSKSCFNFKEFMQSFTDIIDFKCDEMNDFFEEMTCKYKNYSYTTTLTQDKNGAIDVKLISLKDGVSNSPDSVSDFFAQAMSGVQLRGKINKEGGIESFYMKKEQLNLLSLMFELPDKAVKIGDTWTIQVSFISNDQNFICNDYTKTHLVQLVDVKDVNGDLIAFIKYNIRYFVDGDFKNPFLGNTIPTKMDVSFKGISEFNISKGKWENYDGLLSMDVTGVMTSHTQQRFKLIEIENIPEELLDVE